MPADSGNRKPAKSCHSNSGQSSASGAPPPPEQQEQLPCPRCSSTNTKFCYYNNYNFSQPRHFCKGCRRYWTQGGTLRDIPVGGGSRKNAKRSRTSSVCSTPIGSPALPSLIAGHDGSVTSRAIHHYPTASVQSGFAGGELQKHGMNVCNSFTSLLSTPGPGFLALSGFGLGLGPGSGLEEMAAFGLGRGVWAFPGAGDHGGGNAGGLGMMNAWQLEGGEGGGFGGGDCFGWPDLAISTPGGNELK